MNEEELKTAISEIASELKMLDLHLYSGDGKTYTLNERQGTAVQKLLDVLRALNWQLKFNQFKTLEVVESPTIKDSWRTKTGTPVKVRSCKEEHGNKTYFGIMIGDVALTIGHKIEGDTVIAEKAFYNPCIFVPELATVVYGCSSWWEEIKSKEELDKMITDETIKNVWYVKMLNGLKEN